MALLKIGSVLPGSAVRSGSIEERLFCSACWKRRRATGDTSEVAPDPPVYLVIWHSILAGVEQDLAKAEARLAAVDRLDLIGWLDDAQHDAARSRGHFYKFRSDVQRWHEHLADANAPEPAGEDLAPRAPPRLRALFQPARRNPQLP